jgi:hypothetical protein
MIAFCFVPISLKSSNKEFRVARWQISYGAGQKDNFMYIFGSFFGQFE